jgi:hypothetical protein
MASSYRLLIFDPVRNPRKLQAIDELGFEETQGMKAPQGCRFHFTSAPDFLGILPTTAAAL